MIKLVETIWFTERSGRATTKVPQLRDPRQLETTRPVIAAVRGSTSLPVCYRPGIECRWMDTLFFFSPGLLLRLIFKRKEREKKKKKLLCPVAGHVSGGTLRDSILVRKIGKILLPER